MRTDLRASLSALTIATLLCVCSSAQARQAADEPEFAAWLLRVQWHHPLDHAADDQRRINELRSKIDAAPPAERRPLQRELQKLQAEADDRRGHAFYGWSMIADESGSILSQTRSMSGFVVAASGENTRVIAAVKQAMDRRRPVVIAISRDGSADLFNYSGRRWRKAERIALFKDAAAVSEIAPFIAPPNKPISEEDRQALSATIKHVRSEERNTGITAHRFTLSLRANDPPQRIENLRVWFAMRLAVKGEPIGPIIDHADMPRNSAGGFSLTRSFDLIAQPGATVDAQSATVEPVAVTTGPASP